MGYWRKRKKKRRSLHKLVAAFHNEIYDNSWNPTKMTVIHRLKYDLEDDFEERLRSLQTLLNLDYLPAFSLAMKDLRSIKVSHDDLDAVFTNNDSLFQVVFPNFYRRYKLESSALTTGADLESKKNQGD